MMIAAYEKKAPYIYFVFFAGLKPRAPSEKQHVAFPQPVKPD